MKNNHGNISIYIILAALVGLLGLVIFGGLYFSNRLPTSVPAAPVGFDS